MALRWWATAVGKKEVSRVAGKTSTILGLLRQLNLQALHDAEGTYVEIKKVKRKKSERERTLNPPSLKKCIVEINNLGSYIINFK